ncbi:MAG: putative Type IV pilus pilin [Parcubacteria bacterium C7867-006]|nr:MAG: putative Type IV pilus pilin [Parcubacteria bacterium C7867-006]
MKLKIKKYSKGFTLVESLVAIGILSLSIAATFTAVQAGLKTSIAAKDQITAFYLAQEALEYVKNIRDENALHALNGTATWLTGLSAISTDPCYFGKICRIDVGQSSVSECTLGTGTCPNLNKDSTSGLYGYSSGTTWSTTSFNREIQLTSVSADSITVTIRVRWVSGGSNKTFTVNGLVFNRQ